MGGAEVTVLDSFGVTIGGTISDSDGLFFVTVEQGEYTFRVVRIGYRPTETTVLDATESMGVVHVVIEAAPDDHEATPG